MKVQGNNDDAIAYAACVEAGYEPNSRKGKIAKEVSKLVLEWSTDNLTFAGDFKRTGDYQRNVTKYVKRNIQVSSPSFLLAPFWPLILNVIISYIVPIVLDWLLSDDSKEWRMSHAA